MKHRFALLWGLLLAVAGWSACSNSGPSPSDAAVRESFRTLKAALGNRLGTVAVQHVSAETANTYDRCRRLALDAGDTDLETLSQTEVLLVIQFRWIMPKARLEQLDGTGIFAQAIENGLANKGFLESLDLDKVRVTGNTATATLLSHGKPLSGMTAAFELQDGVWRIHYTRMLSASEAGFAQVREKEKKTKVEVAFDLLQAAYGKTISPEVLKGPVK